MHISSFTKKSHKGDILRTLHTRATTTKDLQRHKKNSIQLFNLTFTTILTRKAALPLPEQNHACSRVRDQSPAAWNGAQWSSTYFEFVLESLEKACFAFPLLPSLLLSIIFLLMGGADDEVQLGHRDDPRVAVRPVERDLQSDLSDEPWRDTM